MSSGSKFDPNSIRCFRFVSYHYDTDTAIAYFRYAFDQHYEFVETLQFHAAPQLFEPAQVAAFHHCLRFLHLMLGVSYYKAAVPAEIGIETGAISKASADFFNDIYLSGLGEFAYQNSLKLSGHICFPYDESVQDQASDFALPSRYCVPVGGGKDSIVSISALKQAYLNGEMDSAPVLFSLGKHLPIEDTIAVSGLERILVTRNISPQLLELNQQGAYNGHIPISAIIAFVLSASAVLYGFDAAALSNERSANVGNLDYEGMEVNHQFSKSYAFERSISQFMQQHVLASFRYFSFLRPLSELHIAKLFVNQTGFHRVFTSCNRAFRIIKQDHESRWCLNCPKCRFVFLMLAPFMPKRQLLAIFAKNLIEDKKQTQGYRELLGLAGHKPLECVGEIEESVAAVFLLSEQDEWSDQPLLMDFFSHIIKPDEARMSKENEINRKTAVLDNANTLIDAKSGEVNDLRYNAEERWCLIQQALTISKEHQLNDKEMAWLYAAINA